MGGLMTTSMLLEIGTEELPVSLLRHALDAMKPIAEELLHGARIDYEHIRTAGTPRRLALHVEGMQERQSDLHETLVGPPVSAAFDAQGKLTKAGEHFARKLGVPASEIAVVENPEGKKGKYLTGSRSEPGQPTLQVLGPLLETLCKKIPFQKSMRWGSGDIAFGRPIHWIVALCGSDVVSVEFAGIRSGRVTRGHRFLSPGAFEISRAGTYKEYCERLREAHVWVDVDERKGEMLRLLRARAAEIRGDMFVDAFLVDECASLVEEPHVVDGGFDPSFLELPSAVLQSVMRNHQRYFWLFDPKDPDHTQLLPKYLNVVNTAESPEVIRHGNDRVLRARFADARFFVEEDQREPLLARLPKLDRVVFQAKLGSVGDKVKRIRMLATRIASDISQQTSDRKVMDALQPGDVELAAELCKCDLVTLVVGEFPELQGVMGRWYAEKNGVKTGVAEAIELHHLKADGNDNLPDKPLASVLASADKLDTLVGCFGVGIVPTGSADPYALRRAALTVIRIGAPMDTYANPIAALFDVKLHGWLKAAYQGYQDQQIALKPLDEVLPSLQAFFAQRMRGHFSEMRIINAGMPNEPPSGATIDAVLGAWDGKSITDARARVQGVARVEREGGEQWNKLLAAYKRAYNITKDFVPSESNTVDAGLLRESEEKELHHAYERWRTDATQRFERGAYGEWLRAFVDTVAEPIDAFFEHVLVMDQDLNVRRNRLTILSNIVQEVRRVVHLERLADSAERAVPYSESVEFEPNTT
jgi:glycyl-tRNA synthetase beta chain